MLLGLPSLLQCVHTRPHGISFFCPLISCRNWNCSFSLSLPHYDPHLVLIQKQDEASGLSPHTSILDAPSNLSSCLPFLTPCPPPTFPLPTPPRLLGNGLHAAPSPDGVPRGQGIELSIAGTFIISTNLPPSTLDVFLLWIFLGPQALHLSTLVAPESQEGEVMSGVWKNSLTT